MNTYKNNPEFWDKEYKKTVADKKWTRLVECPQVYGAYQMKQSKKTIILMAAFMSCKIGNHKWCKGEHFYKRSSNFL